MPHNRADILFIPQNPPTEARHGGTKRTAQVLDLIRATGLSVDVFHDFQVEPRRLLRLIRGAAENYRLFGTLPCTPAGLRRCTRLGAYLHSYRSALTRFAQTKVVVLESAELHCALLALAAKRKLRLICVPQNVSVASNGIAALGTGLDGWEALRTLLRNVSQAEAIFTISREEQWLLQGVGIAAHFLPYYPCSKEAESLNAIRQTRVRTNKNHWLVLGTAIHPPTLEGMRDLIRGLRTIPMQTAVTFVGYGVETLRSLGLPDWIQCHDSVDDTSLRTLMETAKGLICHQLRGAGALTRVPDAIVAGVPVLANPIAARSYFCLAGVRVYDDWNELRRLMESDLEDPLDPGRPRNGEQAFQETLVRLSLQCA